MPANMNEYLMFFLAMVPILWLIGSLGTSRVEAYKAAFITLVLAVGVALFALGMPARHVATAVLEGGALGVWPIMVVIISAIFTYKLAVHTKSIDLINRMLSGISTDKRIQVLILAWGFGGFLEAISGYGTSVAIPASILIVLGFDPLFAAVICLIANTVPTAFGAVGVPVTTLAKMTGLDVGPLSYFVAVQLAPFIIIVPFVLVVMTARSFKGLKGVWGITLVSGLAFVVPQLLAARFMSEQMPTLIGSLCSLGATILWAMIFHKDKMGKPKDSEEPITLHNAVMAWLPYILIFVFIIITSPLVPPVYELLSHVKSNWTIYTGPDASPLEFKWINSPGTLIFLATVIGGLLQGAKIVDIIRVFAATLKQMVKSTITVLSIVAVAKVMSHSGMIAAIASVLVKATGGFFPLFSPMIGMLGTFVTGSDTSSNVLFGALQRDVATSIGANPYWLAAANTAGATAGKMISPQSIAVATSAAGLAGYEGKIFGSTVKFCVVYVVILGALVFVGSQMI